ncbi:MAG: metallophosphoesterase family protein [Eubacteriales bacterium]
MKLSRYTVSVGAQKPFTVCHMSDNHICRADGRDDERKRALAARRANEFTGGYPRQQEETAEELLREVRARGIPLLHTGDLIDFVSHANLDYARECLAGIDVLMAAGNHEFSQYVGEAWEDEAYKAQSLARVTAALPAGSLFGVRILEGVKFVTLDNNYYYVTPGQLARLRAELSDGMPAVLAVHNPLFCEDLYRQITEVCGREQPPFLCGCPEERLRHLEERRYSQQKPDETTRAFLAYCESCPNLRAVFAGHLHRGYASVLDSGIPQYVAGAAYRGEMNEYTFI